MNTYTDIETEKATFTDTNIGTAMDKGICIDIDIVIGVENTEIGKGIYTNRTKAALSIPDQSSRCQKQFLQNYIWRLTQALLYEMLSFFEGETTTVSFIVKQFKI